MDTSKLSLPTSFRILEFSWIQHFHHVISINEMAAWYELNLLNDLMSAEFRLILIVNGEDSV